MKTPSFIATGLALSLAALALTACGSPTAEAPAAGGAMSSLEPIDAVPLPLDENPMAPIQVAAPAPKSDDADEDSKSDAADAPAEPIEVASPAETKPAAEARPAKIVAEPRPSREPATPPPAQPAEPGKPVLTF